jgi:SAM-dependent methyltransferase
MNILEHNREAWNRESTLGGEWSVPVSDETIAHARSGDWTVILTPRKSVPKDWFGELKGKHVLCLASGGGQQAPVLAAAGAQVVSFDLSDVQLGKDREVAERHGLNLRCIRGDMANLAEFAAESFDLIFHPVSNIFVPDVRVVWRECFRVLRPAGDLLSGFMNPAFFLFDHDECVRTGKIEVKYPLPYAEPESLDPSGLEELSRSRRPLEFSHSLESQIGGQLACGFCITGFYEDYWTDEIPLNRFTPTSMATRATKPGEYPRD